MKLEFSETMFKTLCASMILRYINFKADEEVGLKEAELIGFFVDENIHESMANTIISSNSELSSIEKGHDDYLKKLKEIDKKRKNEF